MDAWGNPMCEDGVEAEIAALVGKSAGEICYYDFRYSGFYTQVLSNAAEALWESIRSPWTFVEMWNDGTTVWRSPEGDVTATVSADGEIAIEQMSCE